MFLATCETMEKPVNGRSDVEQVLSGESVLVFPPVIGGVDPIREEWARVIQAVDHSPYRVPELARCVLYVVPSPAAVAGVASAAATAAAAATTKPGDQGTANATSVDVQSEAAVDSELANRIAGYAAVAYYPIGRNVMEGYVSGLLVRPSHRRRGLGACLLRALLQDSVEKRQALRLRLHVRVSDDVVAAAASSSVNITGSAARVMYERVGFRFRQRKYHYYGRDVNADELTLQPIVLLPIAVRTGESKSRPQKRSRELQADEEDTV